MVILEARNESQTKLRFPERERCPMLALPHWVPAPMPPVPIPDPTAVPGVLLVPVTLPFMMAMKSIELHP
jgi:hypothetical protein